MSTSAVPPASPFASRRRQALDASDEWTGRYGLSALQIVIGLTVLGGVLRFATLDVQSIWSDEAATIVLVQRGFSGMLSHLSKSETTPPLYFVSVWVWTKLFGTSVFAYRSLSALAGTATIPVMYLAGKWISKRVGVWAALLTAVNPAMYYYSQEARSYALLILFSAGALVCWQRASRTPTARWLAGWAALSILAVLTHYFGAFMFIAQAGMLIRRLGWRKVLPWGGAVALVGIALVPLAHSQTNNVLNGSQASGSWIEGVPLTSRLAQVPKQFLVGLYSPQEVLTTALVGLLALAAIVLLARNGEQRERGPALEVTIMAVVALAIPALLSVTHIEDVFNGRNVMATWVPWAVLLACALGAVHAGRTGLALGAAICAVSLLVIAGVNLLPGYQRDDWHGIAQALEHPAAPRAVVSPELGGAPLFYYMHGNENFHASSVTTREVAFVALRGEHTGHSPTPPYVPSTPPPGFHLVGARHTEAFAVVRFRAPTPMTLSLDSLRRDAREASAEVFLQR